MNSVSIKSISKQVSSGLTPLRSNSEFWDSPDIPWVKTALLGVKNIYDSNENVSNLALENTGLKLNPINTLSIAMYGEGKTRGSVSILKKEMTTNQACCAVTCKQEVLNYEFLYYVINFNKNSLVGLGAGGAQPNISQMIIKNFEIVLPLLEEQQKISLILSSIDEKIGNTANLINKTKELKRGVMKRLLTKGIGHTEFKETEVGLIPKGWEVKQLKDLANIKRGASPRPIKDPKWFSQDKKVGWIRISDVSKTKKYLSVTQQYLSNDGISKSRLVKNNDLIMSICATVGKPIILKMEACIHDGFVQFDELNSEKVDVEFLYYFLVDHEETFKGKGQTGTQANINTNIVGVTEIPVPNISEQKRIAMILASVDEKIDEYELKKEKLQQLKQGLMQKLLAGKIRVI